MNTAKVVKIAAAAVLVTLAAKPVVLKTAARFLNKTADVIAE